MIIDCITDTHGAYPYLKGGDLLIIGGDLTRRDTADEFQYFFDWLSLQDYEKSIVISGNHDNLLQKDYTPFLELDKSLDISIQYLCDSGTEFEGLKIWGSPWTLWFEGIHPRGTAFTCKTEEELAEKWNLIPNDIEILITHSPQIGLFDKNSKGKLCGSPSLSKWVSNHFKTLKLHVCGHIHEGYGFYDHRKLQKNFNDDSIPIFVNASIMNEKYEPINKPIRIEL